jgi:hypothetical protein
MVSMSIAPTRVVGIQPSQRHGESSEGRQYEKQKEDLEAVHE